MYDLTLYPIEYANFKSRKTASPPRHHKPDVRSNHDEAGQPVKALAGFVADGVRHFFEKNQRVGEVPVRKSIVMDSHG